MYSMASVSSPSNTSLNTRKRSRTASAGGDCATVSENGSIFQNDCSPKVRPRSTKYNMRLLPNKVKCTNKGSKANKSIRPTFKSLHNSIVLAPFHTLKKCFQSKLVDLYSYEKMKKKDHKERIAKKQNLSFEYDVFELNSLNKKNLRKWKNEPKLGRKKSNKNNKQTKQKRSNRSKSGSYCQCPKNESLLEKEKHPKSVTNVLKNQKLSAKSIVNQSQGPSCITKLQKSLGFLNESSNKRRKLDDNMLLADTLGNHFEKDSCLFRSNGNNLIKGIRSNSVSSVADVSSLSNIDSWETFSDTPSYKEEHLEGSLAISTTSFDSVLEQYGKDKNLDNRTFRGQSSNLKTKYHTSFQTQTNSMKKRAKQNNVGKKAYFFDMALDFPPKTKANESNHLIMNVRTKISDGLISDFMDREPQEQQLSSAETSQHLQPLRRQSKSKSKKLRKENENNKQYYLRSSELCIEGPDSHNENDVIVENVENCSEQNNKPLSKREKNIDPCSKKEQKQNINVGVGTQEVDETSQYDENEIVPVISFKVGGIFNSEKSVITESNTSSSSPVENSEKHDKVDLLTELDNTKRTESSEALVESGDNKNTENSGKNLQENLCKPIKTSVDQKDESKLQSKATSNNKLCEEAEEANNIIENIDVEEKFEETEKIIEPSESVDIQTGQLSLESIQNLEVRQELQENPSINRQSSQPLDTESEFIFGTRNTNISLGESCEFSFGLNRTLSDDEDSDNRDILF